MPQNDKVCANIGQHRCRNVASVRALCFGMAILPADADRAYRIANCCDPREWGGQRDLNIWVPLSRSINRTRFGKHGSSAVHLPITDDIGSLCH